MLDNIGLWVSENEPALARVVSLVCIAYLVLTGSYKTISNWGLSGTIEQNELFKFLKGLLSSSNGWLRTNLGINYAWPTATTEGKPRPEIKLNFNLDKTFFAQVGSDAVTTNGKLTKSQIAKVSKLARKVKAELDAQAKAGDINRLLSNLR